MDPRLAQALPQTASTRLQPTTDWTTAHPPWTQRYAPQAPPRPYPPTPLYYTPYQPPYQPAHSHSRGSSYGESSSRPPIIPISNSRSTEMLDTDSQHKSSSESKSESPAPQSPPQWQRRSSYEASVSVRGGDSDDSDEPGQQLQQRDARIREVGITRDVTRVALAAREANEKLPEETLRRDSHSIEEHQSASDGELHQPKHQHQIQHQHQHVEADPEPQYNRRPPPPRQLAHLLTEDGDTSVRAEA
jgi:hypothetical protein